MYGRVGIMKETLGVIILIVAFIGICLSFTIDSGSNPDCYQGYHWEEDFRGTVGGCVHN